MTKVELNIMLFEHVSDLHKYSKTNLADFSSNAWYKGLPQGLYKHSHHKLSDFSS